MNRRAEWTLFLLGALLLTALHVVLYRHSGALWRDEIHSVVVARMPGWRAMYGSLAIDSFPGLWAAVLRLWIGIGATDAWMRFLGFVLSVAVVIALWLNARRTSPPVLALAFAAFNPAVFYYGSSLRAYGLALLLVILLFGAVWRVIDRPRPFRIVAAVLLSILCANANYQDSYLIFAVCTAGAVVCLAQRLWGRGALILGIGLAGALSLLPYVGIIRAYAVGGSIRQASPGVGAVWEQFCEAFDPARWALLPLFLLLVLLARRGRGALYGLLTVAISAAALYRFVLASGLPTFPWHFVPFIGLAALALDFAADGAPRMARMVVAAAAMAVSVYPLWNLAHLRRTNIDLAADDVASVAAPRDFVFVSPFWFCYSFKYYYKGAAPWSILPLVPDDRIDLEYAAIKPLMEKPDPLAPAFAKIERTLRSGGRVWIVGRMPGPPPGRQPPKIGPAPDPVHGWDNAWYMQVWAMQTNYFLHRHAARFIVVPEEKGRPVNHLERAEIAMVEGWKD